MIRQIPRLPLWNHLGEQAAALWREQQEVPMIGKTISHYKILEKLDGGGMGVAFTP